MAKPIALITGATSGIGREFAQVFAEQGYDLIVVGRREARLAELAEQLDCEVYEFGIDLATTRGASKLFSYISDIGRDVDVLVNNAGVSLTKPFVDAPRNRMLDIVNVNVRALTELTSYFANHMVERGSGRILNVASVAGFRAVPGLAVYSASKAFVLSFTESLSEELKGTGVTVTALCPGLTETEMVTDLNADNIPSFMMSSARDVALEGYDACMKGEVIRVPGQINQAMVSWMEMQPRWLVRMMAGFSARMSFSQHNKAD